MKPSPPAEPAASETEPTGLPLFRTWKSVYFLVLGSFALWVVLLIALTEMFS